MVDDDEDWIKNDPNKDEPISDEHLAKFLRVKGLPQSWKDGKRELATSLFTEYVEAKRARKESTDDTHGWTSLELRQRHDGSDSGGSNDRLRVGELFRACVAQQRLPAVPHLSSGRLWMSLIPALKRLRDLLLMQRGNNVGCESFVGECCRSRCRVGCRIICRNVSLRLLRGAAAEHWICSRQFASAVALLTKRMGTAHAVLCSRFRKGLDGESPTTPKLYIYMCVHIHMCGSAA